MVTRTFTARGSLVLRASPTGLALHSNTPRPPRNSSRRGRSISFRNWRLCYRMAEARSHSSLHESSTASTMGSVQLKVERPFREYVRRFHYDYLNYYPEALRFLISEVGPDRIVIGTDLFAARDIEYPNSFVEQLNLPANDLELILRGNARRLLRL